MRRTRAADRSAAEQRAAEVGAPAARAADDPARRTLQRRAADVEHSRLVQDPQRVRSSLDVQLVARRPLERALLVRADLGADADVAQQPERASRDGGLARRRGAARPRRGRGGGAVPAEWKRPESSASRSQSDAGAIRASSRRRSSESDMLERQQPPLVRAAERAVPAEAVGGDDAVARNEDARRFCAQNVPAARAAPGRPASAASSP